MGDILKFLLFLLLALILIPIILLLGWGLWALLSLIFGGMVISVDWDAILCILMILCVVVFIIWCLAS